MPNNVTATKPSYTEKDVLRRKDGWPESRHLVFEGCLRIVSRFGEAERFLLLQQLVGRTSNATHDYLL